MKTLKVFVSGKVQGVWFRQSTKEQADRLGITGWVRNLEDGRVEALLQGEEQNLETLKHWLHRGPSNARVSQVEISEDLDHNEVHDAFHIASN